MHLLLQKQFTWVNDLNVSDGLRLPVDLKLESLILFFDYRL